MFTIAQKVASGGQRVISKNEPIPAFLQMLLENQSGLVWIREKDDVLYGIMIPVTRPVYIYKAILPNGDAAVVKFTEGGLVDVKKKFVGRIVYKKYGHAQYADTYVLEHEQGGEIVGSWAHKELRDPEVQSLFVVVDEYMPPIKELYLAACEHSQKQAA